MTAVSLTQRNKELMHQQRFVDGIPKLEGYVEQEFTEQLSIRDRLMRRLEKTTIQVPFTDDLGTFNIEVRLLSPKEQNDLMALYSNLTGFLKASPDEKDAEQTKKMLDEGTNLLNKMYVMAAKICVDPSLNAEYWMKGEGFNIDVPLKLIRSAVSESQKTQGQIKKFR